MVVNSDTKETVASSNMGFIIVWWNGRIILKECRFIGENRVKLKRILNSSKDRIHVMRCLRFVVDTQRYFLANSGSFEIRKFHDLQTHRNCTRNFVGSRHRISVMRSNRSESESVRVSSTISKGFLGSST